MPVPDAIQRELVLPVPPERAWAAVTEPARLSAWFGSEANVDLRPGGALTFVWEEPGGGRHTNRGLVEVVEPFRRFVFRWRPFGGYDHLPLSEGPTTRVEFTLEPHPDGTRLRLVESGFADLPPDVGRRARQDNTRGWERELGDLESYLAR